MFEYGKQDQIPTEGGAQLYPARGETLAFTDFRTGKGIEHIVTSVRRPSTIGKIEAFHKSLQARSLDVPHTSIHRLLELPATTPRNRLLLTRRHVLQIPK